MAQYLQVGQLKTGEAINNDPTVVSPPVGHNLQGTMRNIEGNWLIATAGWSTVQGFDKDITVGDAAANAWQFVAQSSTYPNQPLNPNYNFSDGLTGWNSQACTLTLDSTHTFNGGDVCLMTPNGSLANAFALSPISATGSITPGQAYTSSAWVYSIGSYGSVSCDIDWYNSSGVYLSSSSAAIVAVPAGEWTFIYGGGVAPTNASAAVAKVALRNGAGSFNTLYIDQIVLQPGTAGQALTRTAIWAAPAAHPAAQLSMCPLAQINADALIVTEIGKFTDNTVTNPGFETNTTGWQGQGATIARSTTYSHSGTASCAVTAAGGSDSVVLVNPTNVSAVTPGTQVYSGGWVLTPSVINATFYIKAQFMDASKTVFDTWTQTYDGGTFDTTTWQSFHISIEAPAGAAYVQMAVGYEQAFAGEVFYFDDANSGSALPMPGIVTLDGSDNGYNNNTTTLSLAPTDTPTQECLCVFAATGNVYDTTFVVNGVGFENNASYQRERVSSTDTTGDLFLAEAWTVTSSFPLPSVTAGVSEAISGALAVIQMSPTEPTNDNENWPVLKLEVGFGYGTGNTEAEIVWTDISDRAFQLNPQRGRQYELDSLQAGTLTMVLRNDDGYLTPGNPDSPYNLEIYNPIRLTSYWNGHTEWIFQGYVERWPQGWADPHYGLVAAVAVDSYTTLSAALPVVLTGEVLLDNPAGYWPCNDQDGSTSAINYSGVNTDQLTVEASRHGTTGVTEQFGSDAMPLVGTGATCWTQANVSVGANGYALVYNGIALPPIWQGVSISWWSFWPFASQPTDTDKHTLFAAISPTGTIIEIWFDHNSGACVHADAYDYLSGDHNTYVSEFSYADQTNLYTLNMDETSFSLYINGFVVFSGTPAGNGQFAPQWSFFSLGGRTDGFLNGNYGNMSIANVSVVPRQIPVARMSAMNQAGHNGVDNDFTDWRIGRLLSYINWAPGRRIYYATPNHIGQATDIAGQSVASAITNISNTNVDLLYVDRRGYFTDRTRDKATERPVQATFGNHAELGEIPYTIDVAFDYDPQYIYNDIQVTQYETGGNGAQILATDKNSIEQFGDRSLTRTSYWKDVSQSINLTNWLLSVYRQPKIRVEQITVDCGSNPELFEQVLKLDVGDRVTVKRHPIGATEITADVMIIGVQHNINFGAGGWQVGFLMVPDDTAGAAVNILTCDDDTYGHLDDGNILDW